MLNLKKMLLKLLSVPHVVEEGGTGIHSNWYWRKWSDGRLECWIRREWSTTIDSTWGSLFFKGYTQTPAYPVAFIYNPVIFASAVVPSGNAWITIDKTTQSVTSIGNLYAISPTKITTATTVVIDVYAFGRWKV